MGIQWRIMGATTNRGSGSTIVVGTSTPSGGTCNTCSLILCANSATSERSPSNSHTQSMGLVLRPLSDVSVSPSKVLPPFENESYIW